MNYLTLDLDNGDLVLSDNSVWKSLNSWLDGGTLYSDYYDASNCGDFWVAGTHWISIDSESTYLTFTIEYEFIDASATDSCLCQIKFDGFEDGGVAVTADSSGLNISTDASKHINCDYSNANIKIDITVNFLTKEITTYIHKDNEPLAKKVNVSNYSFTEFVIQAGSRGDIVYKLPTTTKLLNVSVSDVAVSYSNFPETIDYINKLGLARIWANIKSYISSQLLGKSDTGHTHVSSDVTDLLSDTHTWTGDNTFSKTIISQSNEVLSISSSTIGIGEIPANEQQKVFSFKDKNSDTLSYFRHLYQKTGASQLDFIVRNKFTSGSPSTSGTIDYTSFSLALGSDGSKTGTLQATFKPSATNTYDLGTSSYKWKKIYSDDVVHTSGDESVSGTKSFNSDLNLNYASTDVDDIVNSVAGSATLDNFVHMTGNETVSGIKSFPDGVIANVTGSATSATNDGSGNVISSTYGKLGATNEWTGENRFVPSNLSVNTGYTLGTLPQTEDAQPLLRGNTTDDNFNVLISTYQRATGDTGLRITVRNKYTSGQLSPNGTSKNSHFYFNNSLDGTGYIWWEGYTRNSISPLADNTYDLGNSTHRWKTFNGVNPGELSLPNMGTSASQIIDITDWYIPDPDDPTYPDENAKKIDDSVEHTIDGSSHVGAGYIHIAIPNVSGNYAYARQYAMGTNMYDGRIADGLAVDAFPSISFIFPIVNALKVRIKAKMAVVRFFPCLGNV